MRLRPTPWPGIALVGGRRAQSDEPCGDEMAQAVRRGLAMPMPRQRSLRRNAEARVNGARQAHLAWCSTVRIPGTVYRYEPPGQSGLRALRRQIGRGGSSAPPDVLGPVTALRELEAVCDGMWAPLEYWS